VSKSECLPRQSCLGRLGFCFCGWMKNEVYEGEVDTRDKWFARILVAAVRMDVKFNSREQHAIFAHELHSALWLTVGFLDIYCEPS
jgi:hypothetical protein